MIFPWQRFVLVIGSFHLDVFGDYDDQPKEIVDKVGRAYFAAGGTAFNIAAYLALGKLKVALLTILTQRSVISRLLRWKLRSTGIRGEYVFEQGPQVDPTASAFIAHRSVDRTHLPATRHLQAAVSAMPIEDLTFDQGTPEQRRLASALKHADVVIADGNLNEFALRRVLADATDARVRVVAVATSDAKINRLVHDSQQKWLFVALRSRELVAFGIPVADHANWTPQRIDDLCDRLRSDGALLNLDDGGHVLLVRGSAPVPLGGVDHPQNVKSFTGVGSALVAAVVAVVVKRKLVRLDGPIGVATNEDRTALRACVRAYVRKALATWGATPGAGITFGDEEQDKAQPWHRKVAAYGRDFVVTNGQKTLIGLAATHAAALAIGLAAAKLPFVDSIVHLFKH